MNHDTWLLEQGRREKSLLCLNDSALEIVKAFDQHRPNNHPLLEHLDLTERVSAKLLCETSGLSVHELLEYDDFDDVVQQIRERGGEPTDEVIGALKKGWEKLKGAAAKVKDVVTEPGKYWAGVKDIGFTGKGTTMLAGEETFDMEKRKSGFEAAKAKLEGLLKDLNYKPLQDLYAELGTGAEDFPNTQAKGTFQTDIKKIWDGYKQVVADHEAKKVTTKEANDAISVFRALVIYYQNYKIADKYIYALGKGGRGDKAELAEALLFMGVLLEARGAKEGDVAASYSGAYSAKLPLALLLGGGLMAGAGFALDSPWARTFLTKLKDVTTTDGTAAIEAVYKDIPTSLGNFERGEGIIKLTRRMSGVENFGLQGGPSMAEMFGGGKNATLLKVIKGGLMSGNEGAVALDGLISAGADPGTTFVKGAMSGTGKAATKLFGLNKGGVSETVKTLISDGVPGLPPTTQMTDNWKSKMFKRLMNQAPWMKILGLAIAGGGLASAAMRMKGKHFGSRMADMKALVDKMVDIGGKPGKKGPGTGPTPPPRPPGKRKPITAILIRYDFDADSPDEVKWYRSARQNPVPEEWSEKKAATYGGADSGNDVVIEKFFEPAHDFGLVGNDTPVPNDILTKNKALRHPQRETPAEVKRKSSRARGKNLLFHAVDASLRRDLGTLGISKATVNRLAKELMRKLRANQSVQMAADDAMSVVKGLRGIKAGQREDVLDWLTKYHIVGGAISKPRKAKEEEEVSGEPTGEAKPETKRTRAKRDRGSLWELSPESPQYARKLRYGAKTTTPQKKSVRYFRTEKGAKAWSLKEHLRLHGFSEQWQRRVTQRKLVETYLATGGSPELLTERPHRREGAIITEAVDDYRRWQNLAGI